MTIKHNIYMVEYNKKRRNSGICVSCDKPISINSKSYCQEHVEYHRSYHGDLSKHRKNNGLCIICGEPGRKKKQGGIALYCEFHTDKRNRGRIEQKKTWITQGLCCRCGSVSARAGRRTCDGCAVWIRTHAKMLRQEAKNNLICQICKYQPVIDGRKYCEDCKIRSHENNMIRAWRGRFELLLAMGGKCKVCGCDDLEILQIDHIENYFHSRGDNSKKWRELSIKLRINKKIREQILVDYKTGKYQLLCPNCNRKKELIRWGSYKYIQLALQFYGINKKNDIEITGIK